MASYTTTTDGNWNSVTTWGGGGFPTNGDTATITKIVTYNISDDTNTIATINLNTGGVLQWTGGTGTLVLRFTNMTISGGKLVGRDGTFIRCLGYIQVSNTNLSEIDMKGSVPNLQTTMSSDTTIGDGFLSVTSSSGFGVGDHISVYDYSDIRWDNQTNECFIINSISGNNIYIRRFVGPKFSLIQDTVSGTNIFYTDVDVRAWKPGTMKFVIGTEVFTVESIDIFNKIIYTTSNASSTHTSGTTAYESGCESVLSSGYVVYKLNTTIVSAVGGNNYIDVGSSGGWSIGDEIAIGGSTYAQSENKTIQSFSVGGGTNGSDRIYLTSNLSYTHTSNGIVVKINRDCVFHGNTSDTLNAASGYIYILANSANRTFRFENFEMRYYGNTASSLYSGLQIRNSYNRTVLILNMSGRHAYKGGNNGMISSYNYNYLEILNSVVYDTYYGLGTYSNFNYGYISGNIAMKINSIGLMKYDNGGTYVAWDYNSTESCGSWARYYIYGGMTYFSELSNGKPRTRDWYLRSNYDSSCLLDYTNKNNHIEINKFSVNNLQSRLTYREYYSTGTSILRNVSIETGTIYSSSESSSYNRSDTYKTLDQITLLDNYNYISGNKMLRYCYGYAEMDENIRKNSKYSWKMYPKNNDSVYFIGMFALVMAQQGRTIKVGGFLRKPTTTNATVRVDMLDDRNNYLASDTITTTDTWEWKSASYTVPNDMIILVRVGGYGSTTNFWLSDPTIYTDDCTTEMGILSNFWIKGDPESTGIRLMNGVNIK